MFAQADEVAAAVEDADKHGDGRAHLARVQIDGRSMGDRWKIWEIGEMFGET